MTLLDDRIERAAIAICGEMWSPLRWHEISDEAKDMYRRVARLSLMAGAPELWEESDGREVG